MQIEIKPALRVWGKRLQDPQSGVRMEALKALEALGDPDSLGMIGECFATDEHPDVRAMAQWAGKSIYYNMLKKELASQGASEEERQRAAEILAKAREKKMQRR